MTSSRRSTSLPAPVSSVRYFALRDPDHESHMTLWQRLYDGRYAPWEGKTRIKAARAYAWAKGPAWRERVAAAIEADPYAAARDFAELGKCCVCARMLLDPDDATVGLHGNCRHALSPAEGSAYIAALFASAGITAADALAAGYEDVTDDVVR